MALDGRTKAFIVTRLACFDSPMEVQKALKAELKQDVPRNANEAYDPTKKQGERLGVKLRALFDETRAKFLADLTDIPIANKAVRLRMLQKMANSAIDGNNRVLAASLIEQAAKEVGDHYTNRTKIDHAGVVGHAAIPAPTTAKAQAQTAEEAYKLMLSGGPR
jgi:hypothetical protein